MWCLDDCCDCLWSSKIEIVGLNSMLETVGTWLSSSPGPSYCWNRFYFTGRCCFCFWWACHVALGYEACSTDFLGSDASCEYLDESALSLLDFFEETTAFLFGDVCPVVNLALFSVLPLAPFRGESALSFEDGREVRAVAVVLAGVFWMLYEC